jgi:type IV pilus assembly protein PilY1
VLDQIAFNGGTDHAYFADNPTELRTALSAVLSSISKNTTSRTWPIMASVAGTATGNGSAAAYRFYTSFRPRLSLTDAGLWSGVIERNRFVCTTPDGGGTPKAVLQPISSAAGDEFADNVNSGKGTENRLFYTFLGNLESGKVLSTGMLRPNLTADDGAGLHTGTQTSGTFSDFPGKVTSGAMGITDATCATDTPPTTTADGCANSRLTWLVGGSNRTVFTRCAKPGDATCSLIADVYHSTPVVVNRPTDAPRDQTYQAFAQAWAQRPLVLYTSTNDGFLHAFKVASNYTNASADLLPVNTLANNELWAYIPPAVLPDIVSEYPGTHLNLLDGAPVVANVVAKQLGTTYPDNTSPKYAFDRTAADFSAATAGNLTATTWRTVLVQGFGKNRGGYFALDITNPDKAAQDNPYADKFPGPELLWQLTEDSAGRWLFGPSGATPLITTLFFQPSVTDTDPREIAVAILPGGNADPDASGEVTRGNPSPDGIPSGYTVRTSIAKYTSTDALAARSLTIVRLDTGEIVRTFRRSKNEVNIPASIKSRVIEAPLDSPITGQPVAYPALVGSIADRVFVGDRDGALWRVDLSSTDSSKWSMKLFFDAYAGHTARDGQPIVMPPQLSIDDHGQVTVAFSTGSQDDFSANSSMLNYVWSLTENVNNTDQTVAATVNWYRMFKNGERVVGPLQLFGSGLYFATYQPDTGATACSAGSSQIWGMNYHDPVSSTLDASNPPVAPSDTVAASVGGRPLLPEGGDITKTTRVQFLDNTSNLLANATVFGVAVAQVPSCVDNTTPTDSFFGSAGVHTTLPNITSATYELVIQTGASGKSSVTSANTNVTTLQLPAPDNSPRIGSWASIME